MKINTQKVVRCLTTFVVICMIVIGSLTPPAKAAVVGAYNACDYVSGQVVEGDIIHATFTFGGIAPYVHHLVNDVTDVREYPALETGGDRYVSTPYTTPDGTMKYLMRAYLGGKTGWAKQPAPSNGTFYVGDIMPGAELELTGHFSFTVSSAAENVHPGNDVTGYFRIGVFFYDSDGNYLDRYYDTRHTVAMDNQSDSGYPASYTSGISADYSWTLPANVHYILPFYDLDLVWTSTGSYPDSADYSNWTITGYYSPFSISCDINMVYKDSLTMDAIKEELGEVSDKMDELLEGSPEDKETASGVAEEGAAKKEEISGMLEDLDSIDKPSASDIAADIDSWIEPADMKLYISPLVATWENPTATKMVSIVIGLCIVSYLFFGKKGG